MIQWPFLNYSSETFTLSFYFECQSAKGIMVLAFIFCEIQNMLNWLHSRYICVKKWGILPCDESEKKFMAFSVTAKIYDSMDTLNTWQLLKIYATARKRFGEKSVLRILKQNLDIFLEYLETVNLLRNHRFLTKMATTIFSGCNNPLLLDSIVVYNKGLMAPNSYCSLKRCGGRSQADSFLLVPLEQ